MWGEGRTARGSPSSMQFTLAMSGGSRHAPTVASSSRRVSDLPVPGTPLTYMLPGLPASRQLWQNVST